MISREAWNDGALNITAGVQEALRDKWSAVLDRDLLSGAGPAPVPTGLIGQAQAVSGPDLWAAVVTAKAQIAAAGGQATHLAADPDVIGAEESRTDADGRPLWPDGLANFAGVTVVPTAGASEPLLYDSQRTVLVVRSDYEALLSEDYAPAFERYAVALRLTVRMAAAVPAPNMAIRRLEVGGSGPGGEGITETSARRSSARATAKA
jgi:HK97 family phage major capsid protein